MTRASSRKGTGSDASLIFDRRFRRFSDRVADAETAF
jgi:hypothetical protein